MQCLSQKISYEKWFQNAVRVCSRDLIKSEGHVRKSLWGSCFQADTWRMRQNYPSWDLGTGVWGWGLACMIRRQPRVAEVGVVWDGIRDADAGSNHSEPPRPCEHMYYAVEILFNRQSAFFSAVPNMPQQRQDQHHQSAMMHPASAAGPPIAATPPAYSTQYVAYSPQQFPNQPLVQHVPHYQSQVRLVGLTLNFCTI